MSDTAKFEYDLGKGWKLSQYVNKNSNEETMIFHQGDELEGIALPHDSCERLRMIFKKINQ